MTRTAWYGSGQKPVYVGLYERDYSEKKDGSMVYLCHWDGAVFRGGNAHGVKCGVASFNQHLPWRGIDRQSVHI
jgi:hypothetical protein